MIENMVIPILEIETQLVKWHFKNSSVPNGWTDTWYFCSVCQKAVEVCCHDPQLSVSKA